MYSDEVLLYCVWEGGFNLVCTAEHVIKTKMVAPMRNWCQFLYSHLFPLNGNLLFFQDTNAVVKMLTVISSLFFNWGDEQIHIYLDRFLIDTLAVQIPIHKKLNKKQK